VFFAFVLDAGLYAVWQAIMMARAPARYRFTPFFGLAAYLITGGEGTGKKHEGEDDE
jgi:hypothetical protein